jgi:hypothetical protein
LSLPFTTKNKTYSSQAGLARFAGGVLVTLSGLFGLGIEAGGHHCGNPEDADPHG